MKKFIYPLLASGAVLAIASCASDEPLTGNQGDGNVNFILELPSNLASRAFGDGATALNLSYAVYEHGSQTPVITSMDEVTFTGLKATVSLNLVNGKNYDIIWWADNEAAPYKFDAQAQTVTVDYTGIAVNQENRDAFFNHTTTGIVNGPINETVRLYRPFSQVNVGTSDLAEKTVTAAFGSDLASLNTSLKTKAYTTLNLLSGEASGQTDVTFAAGTVPQNETFPVAGYEYISMDYILMTEDQEIQDIVIEVYNGSTLYNTVNVSNAPVQRNYRTNIYGQLLTSTANYNIEIVPDFEQPDHNMEVTVVSSDSESDVLAAAQKGGTVIVAGNVPSIDLTALNPEQPLVLTVKGTVGEIRIGSAEENPTHITLDVPAGVEFPSLIPTKGINIKNLTIKGDPSSDKPFGGISIANNGGRIDIDNVTFSSVHFDGKGINFAWGGNPNIVNNVVVENCVFTNLTEPFFQSSNNQYAGTKQTNITLRGNQATFGENPMANANGVYLASCTGEGTILIENNTITNSPYHGIYVCPALKIMNGEISAASKVIVKGNTIVTPKEDGIKFDQTFGNVEISGNTITPGEYGIRLARFSTEWVPSISVTGNTFFMTASGASRFYAIYMQGLTGYNGTAVLNVSGNIKGGGSPLGWYGSIMFTPAEGSDISSPFID